MSNISITGKEAKTKILKGFFYMASAVRKTMGPFGANTLTEKGNRISNDGLRTAREVAPTIVDEFERRGAIVGLEGASKTEEEAADGTTACITLMDEILKETSELMGADTVASKKSPSEIILQIEKEEKEVITKLEKMAEKITTEDELVKSALVSTENQELADLIGKAQFKLGKDGVLLAEETAERECSVEFVNGVRIDNGFGTSVAINDQEKQALIVKNCCVIMTNATFGGDGLSSIDGLLKSIYTAGVRDLAIIARAFSETAILRAMEETKLGFRIFPINAPYTDQNEVMKDLQAVLGGTYINTEEKDIRKMIVTDIGFAENIMAKRYSALIAGKKDKMSEERVATRIKELQDKLKGEVSTFEKKNISMRIAQLTTGLGIVKIGSDTEANRKYLKDKADDAVGAVRGAWQEGVVKGAGLAFKEIADSLPDTYILKRPLASVYEQLMSRAPKDFKIESWVKDPVKVLRCALHYACETAGRLGTVETVVVTQDPPRCNCNKKQNEE
jgi:chaperonin GroEL